MRKWARAAAGTAGGDFLGGSTSLANKQAFGCCDSIAIFELHNYLPPLVNTYNNGCENLLSLFSTH